MRLSTVFCLLISRFNLYFKEVIFLPLLCLRLSQYGIITMSRKKKFSGAQLKALRKEAGYTQGELALRIGISRETVSAIENEKPETMNNIGVEVISKWWSICRQKASQQTRESFFSTVMDYFGFNLS